jgi:hypothetical protein
MLTPFPLSILRVGCKRICVEFRFSSWYQVIAQETSSMLVLLKHTLGQFRILLVSSRGLAGVKNYSGVGHIHAVPAVRIFERGYDARVRKT